MSGWASPQGQVQILCKIYSLATQSVVREPATASENCLEMQRLRSHPRPAQSAWALEQDPQVRHAHTEAWEAPVHMAAKDPAPVSLPSLYFFFFFFASCVHCTEQVLGTCSCCCDQGTWEEHDWGSKDHHSSCSCNMSHLSCGLGQVPLPLGASVIPHLPR